MQTFLCSIKWENSHFLEAELKHVLPGWSQPPGLGFSLFNVRPLREHPKEESSLLSSPAYQALLQHDAHLKGTELPQGRFLQITQGAIGKQVHTELDACKLDGTDFENGSVSTVLPRMLLLLLGSGTILGANELLVWAHYPIEREIGGCRGILLFETMKKCS